MNITIRQKSLEGKKIASKNILNDTEQPTLKKQKKKPSAMAACHCLTTYRAEVQTSFFFTPKSFLNNSCYTV